MKKTARVIVTLKCNRKCPGCCNTNLPEYREAHTDEDCNYRWRTDVDSGQGSGIYQPDVG